MQDLSILVGLALLVGGPVLLFLIIKAGVREGVRQALDIRDGTTPPSRGLPGPRLPAPASSPASAYARLPGQPAPGRYAPKLQTR